MEGTRRHTKPESLITERFASGTLAKPSTAKACHLLTFLLCAGILIMIKSNLHRHLVTYLSERLLKTGLDEDIL